VQAQDPRGARLAVRARTARLTAAAVDRALDERSLVVTWLNRGTLHLVRAEDYPLLQALTTPPLHTAVARRLALEGLTPAEVDRAVGLIRRRLAADGPLTPLELRERLRAAGVRTEGQRLVHLLFATCVRGLAVRGPKVGREHAYVLARDWLGEPPALDRGAALAELARRYLAGHGPADERDLARWAGLPLRDARAGLGAIGRELADRGGGLFDLARRPAAETLPPPRLLGPFDPLLLGWRSRAGVLGRHESSVVGGGMFRAIALVRGRAAGTWRFRAGKVELEPFARLPRTVEAALASDARDVERFLGTSRQGADTVAPG
jgi:hypothetical protein